MSVLDEVTCPFAIFDLDGTIADATHRLKHVLNKPKDWRAFYGGIPDDPPIIPMVEMYRMYAQNPMYETILMTGREESTRAATIEWFNKNIFAPPRLLLMRRMNDHRPDHVVKREILQDLMKFHTIDIIFEDREHNVQMMRDLGLLVCHIRTEK